MGRVRKPQLDLAQAAGQAFSQLKEGLFETNLDHRLVAINEFGAHLAGFPDVDSCLSAQVCVADLFQEPEELRQLLAALQRYDTVDGFICRMFNARGEPIRIECSVNVLRGDDGERVGYWGVFRDLTPRREIELSRDRLHADLLATLERLEASEQTVRAKNEELEALNLRLREYSAAVTHDLRAPISAVKGFADMLVELYSEVMDERGQHLLDRIRFNCMQMSRIIRGLQELVLSAEEHEARSEVDPAQALQESVANRAQQIEEVGVGLTVQEGMPRLHLQPTKLYQLFDNLLSNALKHLTEVDQPAVLVGCRQDADAETVFFVQDNGPGIPEEHREKVFELFHRLDRKMEGVGLGLPIVQRVVELYGGRIWIEPVEPTGARFCFSLPSALLPETG